MVVETNLINAFILQNLKALFSLLHIPVFKKTEGQFDKNKSAGCNRQQFSNLKIALFYATALLLHQYLIMT